MIAPGLQAQIALALEDMLAVCDGARSRDGQGHLYRLGIDGPGADPRAIQAALHMLRGYPGQLQGRFPGLFDLDKKEAPCTVA